MSLSGSSVLCGLNPNVLWNFGRPRLGLDQPANSPSCLLPCFSTKIGEAESSLFDHKLSSPTHLILCTPPTPVHLTHRPQLPTYHSHTSHHHSSMSAACPEQRSAVLFAVLCSRIKQVVNITKPCSHGLYSHCQRQFSKQARNRIDMPCFFTICTCEQNENHVGVSR